jgi:hypothetical protein
VPTADTFDATAPSPRSIPPDASRARRVPWADLLRRVFADDILRCPCGGRRSVIAVVADPAVARTLLAVLALPSASVTFAPARDPPQTLLAWDEPS